MFKNQDILKIHENKTSLSISDCFKKRFSPKFFVNSNISDDDLKIIFEAVRWTPSSYNRQPWYFYVAKNGSKGFEKLSSLLMQGNLWAKNAGVLILGCYINKDDYGENAYAQYDLGQAVATLVYQAQILDYYTHQMGGFNKDKAKKLVDENHQPWVMIALGKLGDYAKAPNDILESDKKPRIRKNDVFEII
ncbi:MAG: nitroreductase [Patescibacteria group bacterium]|nr:MAG: nitroreductase [Patescibacteria group bacterium]GIW63181.1 MAG: nitroreductase [Patescibacteria group bacterium]